MLYRDQGVVLRTYKLGEADRIVSICTKGHGKVRAVVKGVRKTTSRFGARLEPMSHVALQLYAGRELDIVTQAESLDHWREIREDYDRVTQATGLLEAVDAVLQEGSPAPKIYRMLVGALRVLADTAPPLVVPAFYLRLLSVEGVGPQVRGCVLCEAGDVELVAFDPVLGGTLCDNCRQGRAVSPEAVALLQRILGGELGGALNEPLSPAVVEVGEIATSAMEHHLDRRLRTHSALDLASKSRPAGGRPA